MFFDKCMCNKEYLNILLHSYITLHLIRRKICDILALLHKYNIMIKKYYKKKVIFEKLFFSKITKNKI